MLSAINSLTFAKRLYCVQVKMCTRTECNIARRPEPKRVAKGAGEEIGAGHHQRNHDVAKETMR